MRERQIEMRLRQSRLQVDGLLITGLCLFMFPTSSIRFAQVAMKCRADRRQSNGLENQLHDKGTSALLMRDDSKQVQRIGMVRLHGQDLPVAFFRFRQPPSSGAPLWG